MYEKYHDYKGAVGEYERAIELSPEKLWVYLPMLKAMEKVNSISVSKIGNVLYSKDDFKRISDEMLSKLREHPVPVEITANETEIDRDYYRLPFGIAGGSDTYHALFIANFHAGHYGAAWRYLQAGNSWEYRKRNSPKMNKLLEKFHTNRNIFTKGFWEFAENNNKQQQVKNPAIFIIGAEGSGKELLEQLLELNPTVFTSDVNADYLLGDWYHGQQRSIFDTEAEKNKHKIVEAFGRGTEAILEECRTLRSTMLRMAVWRAQYEKKRGKNLSGMTHYIDTSVNTIAELGWIQLMFPDAVIINTVRDPMDSLYDSFRSFAPLQSRIDWALDLDMLVKHHVLYYNYLKLWNEVMPQGRILHVNMEDVRSNPKATLKPVYKALGLKWAKTIDAEIRKQQVLELCNMSPRGSWKKFNNQLSMEQAMLIRFLDDMFYTDNNSARYSLPFVEPVVPKKSKKSKKKGKRKESPTAIDWMCTGPMDVWVDDGCDALPFKNLNSLPLERDNMGKFLELYFKKLNASSTSNKLVGVEVGVQEGKYSELILSQWKSCSKYVLVDPWEKQLNYFDRANVDSNTHLKFYEQTKNRLKVFSKVEKVYYRNYSVDAAKYVADSSVDFIYIDARHDYCGVNEDLNIWWNKLKPGGIFAGHDYLEQRHLVGLSSHMDQRWDICNNGSTRVRAVRGAVDDFLDDHGLRALVTYADGRKSEVYNLF